MLTASWSKAHQKALLGGAGPICPQTSDLMPLQTHLYTATRAQFITWLNGGRGLCAFAGINAVVRQPRRF